MGWDAMWDAKDYIILQVTHTKKNSQVIGVSLSIMKKTIKGANK